MLKDEGDWAEEWHRAALKQYEDRPFTLRRIVLSIPRHSHLLPVVKVSCRECARLLEEIRSALDRMLWKKNEWES